jgi:two-component system sensor histidine kinase TorS
MPDQKSAHVAVIDDHADTRELCRAILEPTYLVTEFSTATAFLAGMQDHTFDILLIDIAMPDMNGIRLIRTLRSIKVSTPAVALSAHAFSDAIEEGLSAGFEAYVTKPFSPDELRRAVAKLLNGGALSA